MKRHEISLFGAIVGAVREDTGDVVAVRPQRLTNPRLLHKAVFDMGDFGALRILDVRLTEDRKFLILKVEDA